MLTPNKVDSVFIAYAQWLSINYRFSHAGETLNLVMSSVDEIWPRAIIVLTRLPFRSDTASDAVDIQCLWAPRRIISPHEFQIPRFASLELWRQTCKYMPEIVLTRELDVLYSRPVKIYRVNTSTVRQLDHSVKEHPTIFECWVGQTSWHCKLKPRITNGMEKS